ncbi:LAQU0S04e01200g1_1 [Lachancea quebecensis]|uniref:LAQU0S04e01200g1_1 n=1 Tax=Lachancea quebecensis TaxID=1654605 RepID=A0A0P1KSA0_9SACH|nr:LAQU0S04e01200g1_1 [Lachancea quebecensis]
MTTSREQPSHTGLKGATITGDIQDQISFTDANKTIGGYIEDEQVTGIIHRGKTELPRFSSTVEIGKSGSTTESQILAKENKTDDDQDLEDYNIDDDDFFYGDYISTKNNAEAEATPVVMEKNDDVGQLSRLVENSGQEADVEYITSSSDEEHHTTKIDSRSKRRRRSDSSLEEISQAPRPARLLRGNSRGGSRAVQTESFPKHERDEDDKFFEELEREVGRTASTLKEGSPAVVQRVYNIKFISDLEGSAGRRINVKVKGKQSFDQILPIALKTIIKEYNVPDALQPAYETDKVTLYREGVKILNFMNCNSLQIPLEFNDEVCDVCLTIISKGQEQNFEALYEQNKRNSHDLIPSLTEPGTETPDFTVEEYEKELRSVDYNKNGNLQDQLRMEPADDTIRIALMSQNNKKITVTARPETTFAALAGYYQKLTSLPPQQHIELFFDNEKLDLNRKVSDADMEDDDIVEVVIKRV